MFVMFHVSQKKVPALKHLLHQDYLTDFNDSSFFKPKN